MVIKQSGTPTQLHDAEAVVMELMRSWGEVIIGGDLLTVERIDQNKSLRSSNLTEFGKCAFIGPSRIAIFHFRQNILLKVIAAMLPNLNDSSNPGSLNAFRALTDKAKDISNLERKIKEHFELHYQFILSISEAYVEEKWLSFIKRKYGVTDLKQFATVVTENGDNIDSILNEFLDDSSHTVFFDRNSTLEKYLAGEETLDDLEQIGNFFVSLWFLFNTLEFIIKSGDPDGIEFFKKNAILLVLSLHSTASKYVHKGFQELVKLKSMSEFTKLRFNSGSFVKYHGRKTVGTSIRPSDLNVRSEDMVCEWMVGEVKSTLKGLGGNYTEETIDRKMRSMSLANSLLDNDEQSLLIDSRKAGTSWDRFDTEEKTRFKEYVHKLDPFRY